MNILLIRLRLVGDVVFTTPAIRALRQRFPRARLTYLVEPPAAAVVRRNPHLDAVLVIPRSRGLRRLAEDARWGWRLRRARFDVVFDFHGGPRSAWLTAASGAPIRVGYGLPGRSRLYTHRVERPRALRPRHSVLNQWDLLRAWDPAFDRAPSPVEDAVEMRSDPDAAAGVAARLAAHHVSPRAPLIVVHVSAGNPFRRWPEGSFAALIADLAAADASRRIILTAGPSDRAATARVAELARARLGPSRAGVVLEFDDLDLLQLHALVSQAMLFIGGDSGPLHVAATTRVPIVGVYGPTLAERSAPWRDPRLATESVTGGPLPCRPCEQRVCAPGDYRCLAGIAPSAVLHAAERALSRAAARPAQEPV